MVASKASLLVKKAIWFTDEWFSICWYELHKSCDFFLQDLSIPFIKLTTCSEHLIKMIKEPQPLKKAERNQFMVN